MENVISKRSRSLGFGPEERLLIANICAKYKDILENKKTDHVSTHQKNVVWEKIAAELNASNSVGILRSKEVLKRFYENRKREVRKLAAEEKKEIFKTGGGRALLSKKDECHDIFLNLMNKKTVYGLECQVGKDVEPHEEINVIQYEEVNPVNNETWQKYVPSDLLTPISQPLRVTNPIQAASVNNETSNLLQAESHLQQESTLNSGSQDAKKRRYDGVPMTASRRRPTTVKALTRSEFAEKYDTLLDKRLALITKQEQKIDEEIASIQMAREAKLKLDALDYEIKLEQLAVLQSQKKNMGETRRAPDLPQDVDRQTSQIFKNWLSEMNSNKKK